MKRNLHTIAFLLCLFVLGGNPLLTAQDFEANPDNFSQDFSIDLADDKLRLELYINLSNTGTDTLRLKWFRTVISQPENWETQVCDNIRCWLSPVYSNFDDDLGVFEPMILPPDSTYEMILYLLPNSQEGSGSYQLDFSFTENPDSIVSSVSVSANVAANATSTYTVEELNNVYIYPNPVSNQFRISNDSYVNQVEIINMLGRKVKVFESYSGAQYDIIDLPQGVYLVRLIDRNNELIKTMRMSKSRFRP